MDKHGLATYPGAPHVAVAQSKAAFMCAVQDDSIQAIIIQRDDAAIAAFAKALQDLGTTFSSPGLPFSNVMPKFHVQRLTDGSLSKPHQTIGATNSALTQIIQTEVALMAGYFAAASPDEDKFVIDLHKDTPDSSAHPHPHGTLTCAWNCKKGSLWPSNPDDHNKRSKYTNAVKPGDLFYMKPSFWHAGPTATEDPSPSRILTTCLPESACHV